MANAITYVGAGTASATDGGSNPAPSDPSGLVADDLKICVIHTNENIDGSVSISAGWTQIYNERNQGGILAAWYRFHVGGDVAPTLTLTNHAAGDSAIAQIAAWRGVETSGPIYATGILDNFLASQNIGPIRGVAVPSKGLVVCIGGKRDDWTSVADLSGDSLAWTEIGEPDNTLGNDNGLVWDYAISEQLGIVVAGKTFTVTGGAAAHSKGFMISFNLDAPAFSATDHIIAYCAQAHPTVDSAAVGGDINELMRAVFTDLAADDDVEVLSSDVNDTLQSCTIKGRDASDNLVQETKTLNGTTAVIFSVMGIIDRIESVELSGPCVGTITVRRSVAGATIGTIPIGEIGFRRIFAYAFPHPTVAKAYYEKIFIKNAHPTIEIQNAVISENADPTTLVTFTLATSIDDVAIADTRTTVPDVADTDPDTFDNTDKNVPGLNIPPDSAIGVWLKFSLGAAQGDTKNTYTLDIDYTLAA